MTDGQELLALFVHANYKRYIAWTPRGYLPPRRVRRTSSAGM